MNRKAFIFALAAWSLTCPILADHVLSSKTMDIVFGGEEEGFSLKRVINKEADGAEFVSPGKGVPALWELVVSGTGRSGKAERIKIGNLAPCRKSWGRKPGVIGFAWRGIGLPGEKDALDVFVEVKADGELTRWSITSRFRSKRWALHSTVFPYVRGVVGNREADVLIPWKNMGARLVRNYDSEKEKPPFSYAPSCRPPMMAFFKGDAMLYIAAHDPHWRYKTLRFTRERDFLFSTMAADCGVPGKAEGSPRGGFVMACGKGDWWRAAKLYRDWALGQKWCAKGKLAYRKDFTRRAAETELWTITHGDERTYSNQVAAIARAWPDVGKSAKWQRMSHIDGTDAQNCMFTPEWYPMRPKAAETVRWAKDLGFLVMPYTNGRLWDKSLASWTLAEPYACKTAAGGRQTEAYAQNHKYGVMCPSRNEWRKVVAAVTRKLSDEEPHVNAVYIDQVSCSPAYPCMDASHGHPLGGGRWWSDSVRAMMEPIHAEASRKGVVLTSEQFGDYVLDFFDAFLNATEHCADDVPFFPAVYSGYAIYYGTEVHWKDDDAARFAMSARTFTWGVANGWIPGYEILNPAFGSHAEIYYTFGKARKSLRGYLAYGTLVDELRPLGRLPECRFRHWRTETQRGKEAYTNSLPAVIGSVWRDAGDEKSAVLTVNVSGEPQTVKLRPPPGKGALSPKEIAGQRKPVFTISGDVVELSLEPRQIAVLERSLR